MGLSRMLPDRVTWGCGGMADAHGSGPCVRKDVGVQLPPCPPIKVVGERQDRLREPLRCWRHIAYISRAAFGPLRRGARAASTSFVPTFMDVDLRTLSSSRS